MRGGGICLSTIRKLTHVNTWKRTLFVLFVLMRQEQGAIVEENENKFIAICILE